MTLTDALGWTLLHTIWESALAALLLAGALCFLRTAHARYLAACTALVAALAGFAITLFHFLPMDSFVPRSAPVLQIAPLGKGAGSLAFASEAAGRAALPQWIAITWLVGIALFQMRTLGGWLAASRLRRRGVCVVIGTWQTRMNELAAQLCVGQSVELLESSLARVPAVIGHLHPVILIPVGLLTGLPSAQIETILLHELAHIRRRDYLVNLLQTIAEGLLFYHPATWWISNMIRKERENCCDDLVVAVSSDAHQYAIALTSLAESNSSMAMAASGGSVVERVRRLLQQPEGPRAGLGPVFVASLVVIVCAMGLSHAKAGPQPQVPAVRSAETPYTKWLNEDVAYIIRDDERKAFKNLTTSEEREHFIEQFWLRRDPTPSTPENEFRDEHYRRIAYVNVHYGSPSNLPGWKTDRGRVYITYGPADEIESHPSLNDPKKGFPYEQWKYRLIEGVGQNVIIEFDDVTRTGDFRMTMDPNPPAEMLVKP
jgi:GWxTD domain-containing protein